MKSVVRTVILIFFTEIACSWGFLAHRTIGQLAIYELPKKMRFFFHDHMLYIDKEIIQPDIRRSTDSLEAPKHFINLEEYGDSAAWKMPLTWNEAVRLYSQDSLLKNGYVPYEVIMEKNKLTAAFRNGNADSILFYASDLAHYIGDAHVPLHSTINYDGQLTNQKGLHNLWESMIPEFELSQYNLYSGHSAHYLDNPEKSIWDAVRSGYSLVSSVFAQEKEVSKNFPDSLKYRTQVRNGKQYKMYTPAFAAAYSKALGNSIDIQLLKSADLISDFWYSSWIDAGKPDLDHLISSPITKKEKKELKTECKAYRQNKLIEKKFLLSKQT